MSYIHTYKHISPEQARVFLRLWAEGFYKGMSYKHAWELFTGVECVCYNWQQIERIVKDIADL